MGGVDEEFAVSTDAMEMFGVLDLENRDQGYRFSIGIRNANNKWFRLAYTVGLRVFVCQNLAFHGDYSPVLATFEAFLARRRTVPRGEPDATELWSDAAAGRTLGARSS
jgi:hypothetical protein